MGVTVELRVSPHEGRIPGLRSETGLGRPLREFFGVRCGRVKLASSSLGSIWGSVPNYGCPPIRGREPELRIVIPDSGDPCANFLESGAEFFWSGIFLGVRCGRVKRVS